MPPTVATEHRRNDPDTIREVTAAAAAIFTEPPRRAAAITYLKQRGIDATGLGPEWLIGYAPPGWTRVLDQLRSRFPEQALLDAGVVRHCSHGRLIDTFRERVLFGIRDRVGTLAGFIGRDLSGNPNAPKYLNTHLNAVFDKSKLIYGLHEGMSKPITRQAVVVEGPVDVLAIAARRGASDMLPVAASGTAFTVTHAERIAQAATERHASVVVAMDGDSAGRTASIKAADRLHARGVDVRVAVLPAGVDPADQLARPTASVEPLRWEAALPLLNLHVENAIARQGDAMRWPEGRLCALRNVARHITSYAPEHAARQVPWLADALQLNASTVTLELADAFARIEPTRHQHAMPSTRSAAVAI